MNSTFFPSRTEARPMIYAYEEDNPNFRGCLKVGFASSGVEKRVAEQFPILKPGKSKPYRIVFAEYAQCMMTAAHLQISVSMLRLKRWV